MKSQTRLSVHSINQSNRSISVRLSFLFCSRTFISRSYENRSKGWSEDLKHKIMDRPFLKAKYCTVSQVLLQLALKHRSKAEDVLTTKISKMLLLCISVLNYLLSICSGYSVDQKCSRVKELQQGRGRTLGKGKLQNILQPS